MVYVLWDSIENSPMHQKRRVIDINPQPHTPPITINGRHGVEGKESKDLLIQ